MLQFGFSMSCVIPKKEREREKKAKDKNIALFLILTVLSEFPNFNPLEVKTFLLKAEIVR